MTINGNAVSSPVNHEPIISPAIGKPFAVCPIANTHEHLDEAVDGALEAFKLWKQTSFEERRHIMAEMANVLEKNKIRMA